MKQQLKNHILTVVVFLCYVLAAQAQDTIMYHGGYYDGYGGINQANFTPSNLNHFMAYQGGAGDGYTQTVLQQFAPTTLVNQVMYTGGNGDGYVLSALLQFTPSLLGTQSMYVGGDGDGYNMVTQQNFMPSMLAHHFMYEGNSGDGYAMDHQVQFTPSYLTHFTPYAGGQGDGFAGTLIVGAVLPVKLISFSGRKTNGGNLLEWKVSMEKDLKAYELQRSANSDDYETIHTKELSGNSTTQKTYYYLDTEPLEGNNFYRLQMNNINNTNEYSNIVLLVYKKDGQSLALFPNPAQDELTLQYSLDAKASMRITDIKGSLITYKELESGSNTVQIPVSHLAQGEYLLQVVSESGINKSLRFIKQ